MDDHRAALTRPSRRAALLVGLLPAGWIVVLFIVPVATLAAMTVRGASVPLDRTTVWYTLWQASASTALTLLVGMVPAFVLGRLAFRGRRVLGVLATVPFVLPTVVVAAAFTAALPTRLHATTVAVLAAHVFFNVAVVVRLVGASWAVVPDDLLGAARTLGAGPLRLWRAVVVPLLTPGLVAAATVVFLFTFTSFGIVRLLGSPARPTLEVEIVRRATQLGDVSGAVALSIVQVAALAGVVAVSARLQRRASVPLAAPVDRRRPRGVADRLLLVITVATVVVLVAPIASLVARSFRLGGRFTLAPWRLALGDAPVSRPGSELGLDLAGSLGASVTTALVATAASVSIGLLGAVAISLAGRRGTALDIGLALPLGTSAVTVGLGMLVTFDVAPFDWRDDWWLVPLGHALVATPFVVRLVLPALRAIPDGRFDAAATLGASPWRAWSHVAGRPLGRPLLAAAGLAAAISLGEFGATTLLTRSGRETLPIVVARMLGRTGEVARAQSFVAATALLAVCAVVIALTDVTGRVGDPHDARTAGAASRPMIADRGDG